MIRKLLIPVIPLFFLFSCGEIPNRISAGNTDFDTIEKGTYSHCDRFFRPTDVRLLRFCNRADFGRFRSEHNASKFPPPEIPEVDFQTEMIIAALDRPERSGGYSVTVNSLEEADDTIIINITKISPGKRCETISAMRRPFHIIRTAKSDKNFTVYLTRKVTQCD